MFRKSFSWKTVTSDVTLRKLRITGVSVVYKWV